MKLKHKSLIIMTLLYTLSINNATVYGKLITTEDLKISQKTELDTSQLKSTSWILLDPSTQTIIGQKNMNEKLAPASMTKIMTALLVLEKSENNLDDKVFFSNKAVFSIPRDSSNIAMNEGEYLSVKNALYGIMLPSANEVANALAEYCDETISNFANEMTDKAKKLGATNTNFVNPNGLDDSNHYTTAYDMALIMEEAITHPFFIKLISTVNYVIPPTNLQPLERPIINSNKMINKNTKYYDENVVGGKTGYTILSGENLTTYGENKGNKLIVVSMKSGPGDPYRDTSALLKYGFSLFQNVELIKESDYNKVVKVADSNGNVIGEVSARPNRLFMEVPVITTKENAIKDFTYEVNVSDKIIEPVKKGDVIGNILVYNNDKIINSTDLVAKNDMVIKDMETAPVFNGKGNLSPSVDIIDSNKNNNSKHIFGIIIKVFSRFFSLG